MGFDVFKIKKWLWTKTTGLMGVDRAYAKYLAHFNDYQANKVDSDLQQDLNVKAMTKEEFIKVWKLGKKSKKGCCS
jgi:hypothetical protein